MNRKQESAKKLIALEILLRGSEENTTEKISIRKQMSRQIQGIARRHGLSATRLIENWLREKIQENKRPRAGL